MNKDVDLSQVTWPVGEWVQRRQEWINASKAMLAAIPADLDAHDLDIQLREAEKEFKMMMASRRASGHERPGRGR